MTKAEIQLVRSLDDRRVRAETGLFVAEGAKLTREILTSGLRVRKFFFTERFERGAEGVKAFTGVGVFANSGRLGTEGGAASADGAMAEVEAERISPREMERLSKLKTPSDSLAVVEIPQHRFDAGRLRGRLVLALDEVQNPGNMGTIMRLADWFGITDILCSEGTADCFNPKVVQATMGAITRVTAHYGDLGAMIAKVTGGKVTGDGAVSGATDAGMSSAEVTGADDSGAANSADTTDAEPAAMPVYGAFLEGDDIRTAPLTAGGIVVLGSEGRGISPAIAPLVTRKLFIPPYPIAPEKAPGGGFSPKSSAGGGFSPELALGDEHGVTSESLNVAIAAAIICWEFRRRVDH